jgi:hypothetical protein
MHAMRTQAQRIVARNGSAIIAGGGVRLPLPLLSVRLSSSVRAFSAAATGGRALPKVNVVARYEKFGPVDSVVK